MFHYTYVFTRHSIFVVELRIVDKFIAAFVRSQIRRHHEPIAVYAEQLPVLVLGVLVVAVATASQREWDAGLLVDDRVAGTI